ncbi:MAG: hypothetical protein K2O42_03425, partial [Oscillospiraceae bacterium]|nr:hypothetical protein [Oscillospiraceae bacterium]
MKFRKWKSCLAVIVAMASMTCSVGMTTAQALTNNAVNSSVIAMASESSVKFTNQGGYGEGLFAEWSAVSKATGYAVYVDGTKIDDMLIRQYPDCFRADAVGLKAGSHTIKVVPVIDGKEDTSKA